MTDNVLEATEHTRKTRTIDLNTLQRRFEDVISKISAVGVKAFDPRLGKGLTEQGRKSAVGERRKTNRN